MTKLGKVIRGEIEGVAAREMSRLIKPLMRELRGIKRDLTSNGVNLRKMNRTVAKLNRESHKEKEAAAQAKVPKRRRKMRPERIAAIRERLGLSREDFALLAGVTANAVYLWETGRSSPRQKALHRLYELGSMGVRKALAELTAIYEENDWI